MDYMDVSIDDMITRRRNTQIGRGQGRPPRGRGPGGTFYGQRMIWVPRRHPLGVNTRPSEYTIAKSFHRTNRLPWQRDLYEESVKAAGLPGIESDTKLYVSNLDVGVSNEDIKELFSKMGELKRYAIYYDKNGRPSGSAEVMFAQRSDAFRALNRYNNVQLEGKLMKIEIVDDNSKISVPARVHVVGGVHGRRTNVIMQGVGRGRGWATVNRVFGQRSRSGMMNRSWWGMTRGRGRGGGRGVWRKKINVDKSADELDKELENYHAEAIQS